MVFKSTAEDTPPASFSCNYKGNSDDIPNSLKGLHKLSTATMKSILQYHGLLIRGNCDELILRISLFKNGQYRYAFYQEQNEIINTIKDAQKLILAEKMDYIEHPDDIYLRRTYSNADQSKVKSFNSGPYTLRYLHELFKNLNEYVNIIKCQNSEKGNQLNIPNISNGKYGSG